jgi:hypothetical protein
LRELFVHLFLGYFDLERALDRPEVRHFQLHSFSLALSDQPSGFRLSGQDDSHEESGTAES